MIRRHGARAAAASVAAAAALAVFPVPAPAAAATPAPRPLAAGWQFRPDPGDHGLAAGWAAQAPAWGWREVRVPHTFHTFPLARLFGGTVGWYRLRFDAPGARRRPWALRFEQARRRAAVWLNGRRLGAHSDPYTAFELPATGLRPAGNVLVVRIDNRKGERPREGWWNWGGLLRPVELVPRGRVLLSNLGVVPRVRCEPSRCAASVWVLGTVRNRSRRSLRPWLRLRMTAPGGAATARRIRVRRLAPGRGARIRARVAVAGTPALWSPSLPQLYDTTVELVAGGRVQQAETLRTGLREVRVSAGGLELNGQPVRLYGASIQEDHPGRGAALTAPEMDEIVADLRELGANVTRAHYPLNERLLARLDEAGIMVWSQAPVYHQNSELNRDAGRRAALATVAGTVRAARSHPSVIVHSVANEPVALPDTHPGSARFLSAAAALARELDPELPVGLDILTYPRIPHQGTYRHFDVLGVNNYYGWYPGKPDRPTGNFDDLEPYLRSMRALYPSQAMVMTEYGAESTVSGSAAEKGTYEFQSRYIERVLDVVERNPFVGGAIYWTLREFAVKPRWTGGAAPWAEPQPDSIHNKGLIAYDGTRKPAFGVLQARIARALGREPRP